MTLVPQENSAKVVVDYGTLAALRIENSGGLPLYVGQAAPGTGTGSTGWSIKKIIYDADNLTAGQTWASGNSSFDKVWDWRAGSYTYS